MHYCTTCFEHIHCKGILTTHQYQDTLPSISKSLKSKEAYEWEERLCKERADIEKDHIDKNFALNSELRKVKATIEGIQKALTNLSGELLNNINEEINKLNEIYQKATEGIDFRLSIV